MPEPIPPLWFSLIDFRGLDLYDETIFARHITGLDFYGDHVYASVAPANADLGYKGLIVVKNENSLDADTTAYLSSHGTFTTPLNQSVTTFLTHTVDESHNISLVSGTFLRPALTGIYAMILNLSGETTSDICVDGEPVDARNFEKVEFRFSGNIFRYPISSSIIPCNNAMTYANCHLQNAMVTDGRGLLLLTNPTHMVTVGVGVSPSVAISPPPDAVPSSAGTFSFTMQRVSLGS